MDFYKIYLLYNGRITESEVWRPEKGPFLLAVIQNTFRKFLREALVQNRVQTSVLGGNNILEKALHWLMYNEAKIFLNRQYFHLTLIGMSYKSKKNIHL